MNAAVISLCCLAVGFFACSAFWTCLTAGGLYCNIGSSNPLVFSQNCAASSVMTSAIPIASQSLRNAPLSTRASLRAVCTVPSWYAIMPSIAAPIRSRGVPPFLMPRSTRSCLVVLPVHPMLMASLIRQYAPYALPPVTSLMTSLLALVSSRPSSRCLFHWTS